MFQIVSKYFKTCLKMFKMFKNVSKCFKIFQNVSKCFKMLQAVEKLREQEGNVQKRLAWSFVYVKRASVQEIEDLLAEGPPPPDLSSHRYTNGVPGLPAIGR
jgi:hypothetical protein